MDPLTAMSTLKQHSAGFNVHLQSISSEDSGAGRAYGRKGSAGNSPLKQRPSSICSSSSGGANRSVHHDDHDELIVRGGQPAPTIKQKFVMSTNYDKFITVMDHEMSPDNQDNIPPEITS